MTNLDNAVLTKEYRVVYTPEWAKGGERFYYGNFDAYEDFMHGNTKYYVRTEVREVITITGDWEGYDERSKSKTD